MTNTDKVQAAAALKQISDAVWDVLAEWRPEMSDEVKGMLGRRIAERIAKNWTGSLAAQSPEMGEGLAHRWNIERDGDALLICEGCHHRADKCEFVRYVASTPSPSLVGVEVTANDYQYRGWQVARFPKRSDQIRVVVEDEHGRLFIHNETQIRSLNSGEDRAEKKDTGLYMTQEEIAADKSRIGAEKDSGA